MNKTDTAIMVLLMTAIWLLLIMLSLLLIDAGAECMQAVPLLPNASGGMLV